VGPGFNPEVGFVNRTDINESFLNLNLAPRPHIPGIREVNFEGFIDHVPDTHGVLQTQEWQGTFRALFNNGAYTDDDIYDTFIQRLSQPFNIYKNISIPSGIYHFDRHQLTYGSRQDRRFTWNLFERFGTYYSGHLNEARVRTDYRASSKFSISTTTEWDRFRLPQGNFSVVLGSLGTKFSFSRFLTSIVLVQTDTSDTQAVSANVRLRYQFRHDDPFSNLFIIYNVGTRFASLSGSNLEQLRENRFEVNLNLFLHPFSATATPFKRPTGATMKSQIALLILLAAASSASPPLCASTWAQEAPAVPDVLHPVETISLPNVEGRIDHLSVDVQGQRLFVSALGNNTLEVLDLRESKRLTSIKGLREPQGVFFVPRENKLFVANGDDGTCRIFDAGSYNLLATINFPSDADNVRYDVTENQIYVGYGEGALGVLDAATGKKVADIALNAHPESFRLEQSGPRIFVNLPNANHTIAVVDRVKHSVIATWPLQAAANFPMVLDDANHRLLVVTRRPARLVVLDSESGKQVASYPSVGDADDLFYDAAHKRVYISGGEGFIDIFAQRSPDDYQLMGRSPTPAGARTSLFVPELDRLYLAVRHRGNQKAEIRVYEAKP
jgi:DNA-binding beta-propeller fold protein YncE